MTDQSKGTEQHSALYDFIAFFVCLSCYVIFNQIDVISTHIAVALDIPIHNIGIYFDKLFSLRCLFTTLGSVLFLFCETLEDSVSGLCRYASVTWLVFLLIVRLIFLTLLYFSKQLACHVYIVLIVEAFFQGFFTTSLITIASEHIIPIFLGSYLCAILILFVQLVLDRIWYARRLFMIKIQCWMCLILTFISLCLWAYYISKRNTSEEASEGTESEGTNDRKDFFTTLKDAFSPFIMYFVASLFYDFLYPGVLPYGLLERDKCHMINMMIPIVAMIGPLTLFALEELGLFPSWTQLYDLTWFLMVPMVVVFTYSVMAIHTRVRSAKVIANSRSRVLVLTLSTTFLFGFFEPLSYVGVSKVVNPESTDKNGQHFHKGDETLIPFHDIMALFLRFIFAKLSVGYNDTRISLGYTLPRFRPKHRMSKKNQFWYIFKNTFRIAYRDMINDFRLNIKKYL